MSLKQFKNFKKKYYLNFVPEVIINKYISQIHKETVKIESIYCSAQNCTKDL